LKAQADEAAKAEWRAQEEAAAKAKRNVLSQMASEWSTVQRMPFRSDFLGKYATFDPDQANVARAALGIEVEKDESAPGLTPAPINSFGDLVNDANFRVIPSWIDKALQENGWTAPMKIQAQAFPILLAGRNFIGIAQTGSGKTIAFLLPAVIHAEEQRPLMRHDPGPIVLVLAPTRELAVQISEEADKLIKFSYESRSHPGGLRSVCFYGGGKKYDQLRKFTNDGSHIVVATPGRLIDFCGEYKVTLKRVTYFCLDEADRILDMGFSGDMEYLGSAIRPDRQMAFFSATWPKEVEAMALKLCSNAPVIIRIGRDAGGGPAAVQSNEQNLVANKSITQEVVVVDFPEGRGKWDRQDEEKKRLLDQHIKNALASTAEAKVLIFVNTKTFADELSNKLWEEGILSDAIHGGRPQEKRLESLDNFRRGTTKVLIATDVIGRGLDIPNVSHVVVYSMNGVADYIHRIGRTGRGVDKKGHALVFFEYMPKQPDTAKELIAVLEKSEQLVPPKLREIADDVVSGKRENAWAGWSNNNGKWEKTGSSNWQTNDWSKTGGWKDRDWKGGNWNSGWQEKDQSAGPCMSAVIEFAKWLVKEGH